MTVDLTTQQWQLDSSHQYSGKQLTLLLTSHLIGVGIEDFESALKTAERRVEYAKVGDTITDAYGQEFRRVQ